MYSAPRGPTSSAAAAAPSAACSSAARSSPRTARVAKRGAQQRVETATSASEEYEDDFIDDDDDEARSVSFDDEAERAYSASKAVARSQANRPVSATPRGLSATHRAPAKARGFDVDVAARALVNRAINEAISQVRARAPV